jgi:hypothetical protein
MQFENWTWGFQNQWYAVCLFALWAFEAVERCGDFARAGNRIKANGWLVAAWLCAIAAAMSMASGLLVIVVVAAQAAHRRIGMVRAGLSLLIGAAIWLLYLHGWHPVASPVDARAVALANPAGLIAYALLYLGSAGAHVPWGCVGAYVWGTVVAAVVCAHAFRSLISAERTLGSFLAFSIFGVANALLTASGRLVYGMESALASRYTTISLLCALTLLLFALANAKNMRGLTAIILAACLAIAILVLFQRLSLRGDEDERYGRDVGGLALRAHVYDSAVTKPVYPFADRLVIAAKNAEAAGLSIFSRDQRDFLVPPPVATAASRCDGRMARVWATGTPGVYGASGWIFDASSGGIPDSIVIAKPDGSTIGTGIVGGRNEEAHTRFGSRARDSDWTAFFRAAPGTQFIVEGRIGKDRYCSLGDAGRTVIGAAP